MTKILLCQLSQAKKHTGDILLTMVAKPVKGVENVECLTPSKAMVYGYKQYTGYKPLSEEEYTKQYVARVNEHLATIVTWYKALSCYETVVLCCYCREGVFCHRRIVYQLFLWLNERLKRDYELVLE